MADKSKVRRILPALRCPAEASLCAPSQERSQAGHDARTAADLVGDQVEMPSRRWYVQASEGRSPTAAE